MNLIPTRDTPGRITRTALAAWNPAPIPAPQLAPDVLSLPALERAAEILRYRLLCVEYALSPSGALRAWIKMVLRIALVIGIPALLLGPILVAILNGIAAMAEALVRICIGLLKAVVAIIAIVVLIAAFAASCRRSSR